MSRDVFPSSTQDAGAVTKALPQEFIPSWGILGKLSSDNGAFVSTALRQVSDYPIRHHCAYYPASAGAVERETASTV